MNLVFWITKIWLYELPPLQYFPNTGHWYRYRYTSVSYLSSMIIGLIRAHALLSRNIGESGEKLLSFINKSKLISWRQRPDHESLIMTLFKLFFNNFEDSSPEQLSSIYNLHPQSYLKDRLTIKSNFQTWSLSQRFWLK